MARTQHFRCAQCGHAWIGTTSTCPQCTGVAKSEGEYTRKTFQGDDDLKKGLR